MCESMSARPVILDCEDTILVSRHHLWCAPPLGRSPLVGTLSRSFAHRLEGGVLGAPPRSKCK